MANETLARVGKPNPPPQQPMSEAKEIAAENPTHRPGVCALHIPGHVNKDSGRMWIRIPGM
jgi:hypothetical protein